MPYQGRDSFATDGTNHLEDWLANLDRSGKSSHTIAAYRRGLEHFIDWNRQTYGTDACEPAKVIPRDVRDWKSYQKNVEKAADSTVAQRVTALTQFFRWAKGEGLVDDNPAADVSVSAPKKFRPESLDSTDLRKLLRAARVGGSRTVPLVVEVRKALMAYLQTEHPLASEHLSDPVDFPQGDAERDNLNRVLAGNPHESLWYGERGPLKARSAIRRILDKYALAARLDSFGPHVLRHTFAYSFLQENPGNLRELAAILGHKNLQTVMVYTEPHFDDLAEQMERTSRRNGDG